MICGFAYCFVIVFMGLRLIVDMCKLLMGLLFP